MITPSNYRTAEGERAAMAFYDEAIARWPVAAQESWMETRSGPTFVLTFGRPDEPPLVLLHGGTSNSATWAPDAAAYARHFRVHAVDIPGEAGKSAPTRPPYRGTAFASWLGDVLDGLAVEQASIAGLSLGGWVALKFAATAPERVERIVLISPGGVVPARRGFVLRAIGYRLMPGRGIQHMTRLVFAPNPPAPGAAEAFAFIVRHFRPRAGSLPCLPDDELRCVQQPTLLIGGEADRVLDIPATHRRLARFLPQLEAAIIPNAGHALIRTSARTIPFLVAAPA